MWSMAQKAPKCAAFGGDILHLIAQFTMHCVISLMAAKLRSSGCVRSKRSPGWLAVGEHGRSANPPVNFSKSWSRPQGVYCDSNVHVLYLMTSMPRRRSSCALREVRQEGDVAPTPERRNQGAIERLERPLFDSSDRSSRPYRVVDTLAAMERRGTITAGMRQAGEDFRVRFAIAQLDPLSAFDITRVRTGRGPGFAGGDSPGSRIEQARLVVWRAVLTLGGLSSAGGSCAWHVLGCERTLKEWALEQGWNGRRVSQEAASGILVGALGALEAYFSNRRRSELAN